MSAIIATIVGPTAWLSSDSAVTDLAGGHRVGHTAKIFTLPKANLAMVATGTLGRVLGLYDAASRHHSADLFALDSIMPTLLHNAAGDSHMRAVAVGLGNGAAVGFVYAIIAGEFTRRAIQPGAGHVIAPAELDREHAAYRTAHAGWAAAARGESVERFHRALGMSMASASRRGLHREGNVVGGMLQTVRIAPAGITVTTAPISDDAPIAKPRRLPSARNIGELMRMQPAL